MDELCTNLYYEVWLNNLAITSKPVVLNWQDPKVGRRKMSCKVSQRNIFLQFLSTNEAQKPESIKMTKMDVSFQPFAHITCVFITFVRKILI